MKLRVCHQTDEHTDIPVNERFTGEFKHVVPSLGRLKDDVKVNGFQWQQYAKSIIGLHVHILQQYSLISLEVRTYYNGFGGK